jgi:hypothetical protein
MPRSKTMSNFVISNHAREQMLNRGIDETLVLQVLANPLQVVEEDGLEVYQSIFKESAQEYLLRVFVNSGKNPPLVVTVYKTSKIKKYLQ